MIKEIIEGLPDQGKTLITATIAYKRLRICKKWWEKQITIKPRHIAVDPKVMKFSGWVEQEFGLWPNGYIQYYNGLKELPQLRQCDVFLDDMGTQFAARRWAEMSGDIQDWFRLMGHYECDVYGNAQDFLDIDISIRRKTMSVVNVHKLCGSPRPGETYPPIKKIWGIIIKRKVHYSEMDKEEWKRKESKMAFPTFITKFNCSLYDTLQKIPKAEYPPYDCVERKCNNPDHVDYKGRPFRHFVHV